MWGRFWDSFGAVDHTTDTSSQISDTSSSHLNSSRYLSAAALAPPPTGISPQPSTSLSQLRSFSDVTPNESASMVNQETASSSISAIPVANDDITTFTFKFTSAAKKTHRVVCKLVFNELLEAVRVKMTPEHGDDVGEEEWLTLSYLDDEQDNVLISCDTDVVDAVHLAKKAGQSNVKLLVHDKNLAKEEEEEGLEKISSSDDNEEPTVTSTTKESTTTQKIDTATTSSCTTKKSPITTTTSKPSSSQSSSTGNNPLLLPAAIGFLGLVITGVFIYSRVQPK